MIKLLNSWAEVGEAIGFLSSMGSDKNTRVFHSTPVKNWDLAQIASLLKNKNKHIRILDMGCGGSNVLRYCYKQRFINTYGIDITVNFWDRLQQLTYWKNNSFKIPYHLFSRSVTETHFPDGFFDAIICLSVIEHEVNVENFLKEVARILRKKGEIYLSTDYHETKIETYDTPLNYESMKGKWNIFSKKEIHNLISHARKYGLFLQNQNIPKMRKPVVNWNTKKYSFISLVFTRY